LTDYGWDIWLTGSGGKGDATEENFPAWEELVMWQMQFFQQLPVKIRKKLIGGQDFNLNDPEVIRMLSSKMVDYFVEFYDRSVLEGRVMAKTEVAQRMLERGVAKDLIREYTGLNDEEKQFVFGGEGCDCFDDDS
jgi:hypothetical protein